MEKFKPMHQKLDTFQIDKLLKDAKVVNAINCCEYLILQGADRHMVEFYIDKVATKGRRSDSVNYVKFLQRAKVIR